MVHLHSEKKHEKSGCFGTFYHISVIIKPILNAFFSVLPVLPWSGNGPMVQRNLVRMPKTLSWNSCSASRFNRAEDSPWLSGWSFHRVGNQQKFDCDRWHFPVGWYAEVNRAPARGWVIRWQQASQSLSGRGKFWHLDTTDVLMILSRF